MNSRIICQFIFVTLKQRIYAASFNAKIESIFELRLKERRNIHVHMFAVSCEISRLRQTTTWRFGQPVTLRCTSKVSKLQAD